MRLTYSLFLLLFFLGSEQVVHAEQFPVLKYNVTGSGNFYPYYIDNRRNPGILPEVIAQILTRANIDAEHIELPAKRTVKYLHLGNIDFDVISRAWLSEQEQKSDLFRYSENLFAIEEYLVSLEENIQNWQQLRDLTKQPVGTVLGYYYYDDKRFKRVDFHSEKELIKALKMNRIEVIIIDKLSAKYWANQLDASIAFGARHSNGYLQIRLRSEHQAMLPVINDAIRSLKKDGTIEAIISKYTKTIPLH